MVQLKEKQYQHRCPFLQTAIRGGQFLLRIRQATEQGYIECEDKGVFDAAYPSSLYRRARVKERGHVCSALMSGEPTQWLFMVYDL